MFFNRLATGFQIAKDSFIVLWQHKILSVYMAIATVLFAISQYLITYNFLEYSVEKADGTSATFHGVLSSSVSLEVAHLILTSKATHLYLAFFAISSLYEVIINFFAICLMKHVLQIRENKQFSLNFLREKIPTICSWFLFLAVLRILETVPLVYWGNPIGSIITLAIGVFTWFFIILVLPIIADTSLNIFSAMALSLKIILKHWVEYLGALLLLIVIWLFLAYPFTKLVTKHMLSYNHFIAIIINWIPSIIALTITDIMRALFYKKFNQKA